MSETAANAAVFAQTEPATWISLHSADPGTTGANELGVARLQTTWAATLGGIRYGSEVVFDVPAGATVTHFGVWTAEVSGTFYSGHKVGREVFGNTAKYALLPAVSPGIESADDTSGDPGSAADGVQAAVLYGWGPAVDGDEFTTLDLAKWGLYNGPGHANKGIRSPAQISVVAGKLVITGTSNGTTGGMAFHNGRYRGRWEARMRVPLGDYRYHPVLLLWPDAEDWLTGGGEIDYAETNAAAGDVDFFLHYGPGLEHLQTTANLEVDITQWHNYAVEWDYTGIRGYVDGVQWFEDTDPDHMPPGPMHPTIQLDWFPSTSDLSPTTQSTMEVDWVRVYEPVEEDVEVETPDFVNYTAGSTDGTTLTLAAPTGVTSGDDQLLILAVGTSSQTFTVGAGWTLLQTITDAGTASGDNDSTRVSVYVGTDAGAVTITKSASTRLLHAVRVAWRGNASTGFDASTDTFGTSYGTNHALPEQDVTAGERIVGVVVVDSGDNFSTSLTAPAGWLSRYNAQRNGSRPEAITIGVFDYAALADGTDITGTVVASRTDVGIKFSVVLNAPA